MTLASTYSYIRGLGITGYTHRIYLGSNVQLGQAVFSICPSLLLPEKCPGQRRFTVKLRDSGGFLFRSYPFLFPEVKCLSVANDQKSVWKEKFTSLNIKHSQIFLSMCFVSSVHGTLVLTQALASDYVCLEYSISQRAGRNKQNTHQEIVPQKLKSVGGSPR